MMPLSFDVVVASLLLLQLLLPTATNFDSHQVDLRQSLCLSLVRR